MSEKIEQSVRTASVCAMRKGLTAYEGEAVYRRYFEKDGKTLDDACCTSQRILASKPIEGKRRSRK